MLTPYDHALAVVLAVLFPIRARYFGFGRLERATPETLPAVRGAVYRGAMVTQWSLAAAVALLWYGTARSWSALLLVPVVTGGLVGVLAGFAVIVFVVWRQRTAGLGDARAIDALRRRTASLERMMPRAPGELRAFYLLSLTAGICEELLYRGYLLWYLQQAGLALLPAAAVSSLVFGFGHLYQGLRGIVTTGLVGAFLAAVVLLAGSLYPAMLFHAAMDAYSGQLLYTVYRRETAPPEANP